MLPKPSKEESDECVEMVCCWPNDLQYNNSPIFGVLSCGAQVVDNLVVFPYMDTGVVSGVIVYSDGMV